MEIHNTTQLLYFNYTDETRYDNNCSEAGPCEVASCRQPSSMSNASEMLRILDLVSLARLAG